MKTLFLMIVAGAITAGCWQGKAQQFKYGIPLGQVDERLEEASGLVASIANDSMFWTLNDSGNPPDIFLIDRKARIRMVCHLAQIRNRDWEDIAIGAGPDPRKNYLYIADIGDNFAIFDYKYIYRIEEPVLGEDAETTITRIDTIVIKLPDGRRDSETIMIDPSTKDLYLISKREHHGGLYKATYPFKDTVELQKLASLPFNSIVAGSISRGGEQVVIKNYSKIYYWRRKPHENLENLLTSPPIELPYDREPQGEAIAWSPEGDKFYTLSESVREQRAYLFEYKIKK